jgi:hypothetical protein
MICVIFKPIYLGRGVDRDVAVVRFDTGQTAAFIHDAILFVVVDLTRQGDCHRYLGCDISKTGLELYIQI